LLLFFYFSIAKFYSIISLLIIDHNIHPYNLFFVIFLVAVVVVVVVVVFILFTTDYNFTAIMKFPTKKSSLKAISKRAFVQDNQLTVGHFFGLDYFINSTMISNKLNSNNRFKCIISRLASHKLNRLSSLTKLFDRAEMAVICQLFGYLLSYKNRFELFGLDSSNNRRKHLKESNYNNSNQRCRIAASTTNCNYSLVNLNKRQLRPHNREMTRAAYKSQSAKRKYSMYLLRM
jgi:uncharacterized membrane protein